MERTIVSLIGFYEISREDYGSMMEINGSFDRGGVQGEIYLTRESGVWACTAIIEDYEYSGTGTSARVAYEDAVEAVLEDYA